MKVVIGILVLIFSLNQNLYFNQVETDFSENESENIQNDVQNESSNQQVKEKLSSSPITINGNGDFLTCGCVSSGDGSQNDPYIIENLDIQGNGFAGVNITHTDSYFIVQNVEINGSDDYFTGPGGFDLYNVTHGKFINNYINNDNR